MDPLLIARWQYAIITVYHFFFVPLTLGLTVLIAMIETRYVRSGDETYKRMARYWGTLLLINFAIGVATGIVQEFQFGMNWSEYSRMVGDIFGAPLAIEALLAFFLESVFIGVWVFGWSRLSKRAHMRVAWLVAIGSNLSAIWILVANSWMQEPVGYVINPETGYANMTDFLAIATNHHVLLQFPHVFTSGMTCAGFFVMGISAWHLARNRSETAEFFRRSFTWAATYATVGVVLVSIIGHTQAQHMVKTQPMKMAAAEAVWDTVDPAGLSVFATIDVENQTNGVDIRIPHLLSFLTHNRFSGEVRGMKEIQAEYEVTYGPGEYRPPVWLTFWSFRLMIVSGLAMLVLAPLAWWMARSGSLTRSPAFLKVMVASIALPTLAISSGWIMTEIGRQPWIVFGLMRTEDGISTAVSSGEAMFGFVTYLLVYTALIVAYLFLMRKYAIQDPDAGAAADAA